MNGLAVLIWAWQIGKQLDLAAPARLVLLDLADRADRDTNRCHPSAARIAEDVGLSEPTVRRHLHKLAQLGVIRIVGRAGQDGRQTSNEYVLQIGAVRIDRGTPGSATTEPDEQPDHTDTPPTHKREAPNHSDRHPLSERQAPPIRVIDEPSPYEPPPYEPTNNKHSSPKGDTSAEIVPLSKADEEKQVFDAYNEHHGNLPGARVLTRARRQKIRTLIREIGSAADATAAMILATQQAAADTFWLERGYGLDNLLAGQKVIQKAETAVQRGGRTNGRAAAGEARAKRWADKLRQETQNAS